MSSGKYMGKFKVLYLNSLLNRERLIPEFNIDRGDCIPNLFTYYYYIKLSNLKKNSDARQVQRIF